MHFNPGILTACYDGRAVDHKKVYESLFMPGLNTEDGEEDEGTESCFRMS